MDVPHIYCFATTIKSRKNQLTTIAAALFAVVSLPTMAIRRVDRDRRLTRQIISLRCSNMGVFMLVHLLFCVEYV